MIRLLMLGTSVVAITAMPAAAQRSREITPYIEVGQVLTADLQSNDVLTYTSLAAGVDATFTSRRVEVQLSYKYEHRIDWDDPVIEDNVHSGLARAAVQIGRGATLEAGALATRARADIRGAAPGNLAGNAENVSQIYSAYAGPTLATELGDATVNAGYRFGYTKAEAPSIPSELPGQPPLNYYDESTSHLATASIGVRAGEVLPVGLTVSGAWEREDVSELDQRYEGKYARADAVLPVSPTVALVAGAGYEKIEVSQRDPVIDAVTLQPVQDGNGRFVTAPGSPRRIAYDTDGLFWDAGVIWRPSQRTSLEARLGERYDSFSVTGSLSYQISSTSGIQVGVYDTVNSFGRGLRRTLSELPTNFNVTRDPFGDQFSGCVFGTEGDQAGGCFNPVLGALTTANYRQRGVTGVYSATTGRTRFGVGLGYDNRKLLVPGNVPALAGLNGATDETWYGQLFAGRALGRNASLDANAYVNYFTSGLPGSPDVFGGGANGQYSYSWGRFGATASVGVFAFDQDLPALDIQTDVSAQALLGMRYSF